MRDQDGAESAAATATVAVTPVDDAPVAAVLALDAPEDTALSFTAAHFEGVFSDPDPDDSLKAVRVASLPAATAGALALDGSAVSADDVIVKADLGRWCSRRWRTGTGRQASRSRSWISRMRSLRLRRRRSP